jgi:adenylate cyclase
MTRRPVWERISSLGARPDDSPDERRRVAIANQGAVAGIVSCATFGLGFLIAGGAFETLALANACVVVLHLASFPLTRAGHRTLAKLTILVPVHALILFATLRLGLAVGFQYYFFVFAALAYLFFGERERALRGTFASLSTACFVFVILASPAAETLDLAPMIRETVHVASAVVVMATMVFFVRLFTGHTRRAETQLAVEHARSERLLLNVLPASISSRLKDDDKAIADAFDEVTILFADLVGFTELSQRLGPEALVEMLNSVFSAFDDLAEQLGLEKIKTIGDCYMVAAGLPDQRPDHVEAAATMALGMLETLSRINHEKASALQLRIGLHTGPVVAGVIGKRKFIYDVWGDTVNTASRMESSGLVGQIQVTKQVQALLAGKFALRPRGTIVVKGKGEMETFLLRSKA